VVDIMLVEEWEWEGDIAGEIAVLEVVEVMLLEKATLRHLQLFLRWQDLRPYAPRLQLQLRIKKVWIF
jgi:hypothetical protein